MIVSSVVQLLGDVFSSLTAAVGAADKVVELMQQRPGIPAHGGLQPADFAGRVELDSVAFSYPARPEVPVLNGLSLKVEPGEVTPCAVDSSFWSPCTCLICSRIGTMHIHCRPACPICLPHLPSRCQGVILRILSLRQQCTQLTLLLKEHQGQLSIASV